MRAGLARALCLSAALAAGCTGGVRHTTTARTPQDMLRLSLAAERAALGLDPRPLRGRRAWVEVAGVPDYVERSALRSALRDHLAWHDVPPARTREEADVLVEVRVAALGPYEAEFKIGLPPLPLPVLPGSFAHVITPDLTYGYEIKDGWAALEVFVLDARTGERVLGAPRLWGRAHQGIRQDVWPDDDEVATGE
ncbi:MAG: hypothetical protein M9894_01900 [Planctomycetes bacterium]|nr:hypothetical protein [Planctomycetota bacterium]